MKRGFNHTITQILTEKIYLVKIKAYRRNKRWEKRYPGEDRSEMKDALMATSGEIVYRLFLNIKKGSRVCI